jgi:hypothetical protein
MYQKKCVTFSNVWKDIFEVLEIHVLLKWKKMVCTEQIFLPLMAVTGKNTGFVQILHKVLDSSALTVHCVVHQENLRS